MDANTTARMRERRCSFCNKLFETEDRAECFCSFLCHNLYKGKQIADEWVSRQRTPEHDDMMRKARIKATTKMNNIVKYLPATQCRPYKSKKGKVEI